jgi:hypothetical protein
MKKGKLIRGAEGGQQDGELHPSANPLHSTTLCAICVEWVVNIQGDGLFTDGVAFSNAGYC